MLAELRQVMDRDLARALGYHVQRLYERAGWGREQAIEALRDAQGQLEEQAAKVPVVFGAQS